MKRIPVHDTEGRTWYRLVPENEQERRELAARADLATGGIGTRDDSDSADGELNDT